MESPTYLWLNSNSDLISVNVCDDEAFNSFRVVFGVLAAPLTSLLACTIAQFECLL